MQTCGGSLYNLMVVHRCEPEAAHVWLHIQLYATSMSTASASSSLSVRLLLHITGWPGPLPVRPLSIILSFSFFPFLFVSVSSSVSLPGLTSTVYSNTSGCSEPMGMKSRLVSDRQITSSSTFRTWGLEAFTWHPHYARLDKQGKTNAWTAATNNQSEWLQVREEDRTKLHNVMSI